MAKRVRSRAKQARLDLAAKQGRTLSLQEVSRVTGIAVSTLRRIEENKAEGVDFSTLTRLAEFYQVTTIDDLFQIVDERLALRLAVA